MAFLQASAPMCSKCKIDPFSFLLLFSPSFSVCVWMQNISHHFMCVSVQGTEDWTQNYSFAELYYTPSPLNFYFDIGLTKLPRLVLKLSSSCLSPWVTDYTWMLSCNSSRNAMLFKSVQPFWNSVLFLWPYSMSPIKCDFESFSFLPLPSFCSFPQLGIHIHSSGS